MERDVIEQLNPIEETLPLVCYELPLLARNCDSFKKGCRAGVS
jgi:hypothetical protein